jgi:hypothetical protein
MPTSSARRLEAPSSAGHHHLVDRRFVCIGDREALWEAEDDPRTPPGTEITPCVLPRLALGLTRGGSLVELLGWSVQT